MRLLTSVFVTAATLSLAACQQPAQEDAAAATTETAAPESAADGEAMERQLWADIVAENWTAVESKLSPALQSVHTDGPRDRAGELELLRGLNLAAAPEFSDFKVTQNGDVMVVTYRITTSETIDGKTVANQQAMRVSVWQNSPQGWQWVSHVNLTPV